MGRKVSILSGIALLICSSVFAAQRTDRLDLIATTTTPGRLDIYEAPSNGSSKTRIQTQAQAGDITYTLPPDDGDASYVLTTDGSGSLTWEAGGGGSGDITQVGNVLSGAAGTSSSNDVTFGNIQATRIGSVSTGDASFSALAVDTNVLYVNPSSNNVGIGTASPSAPLHVSNVNPTISIQDSDSTGDGQIGYVSFNDSANVEQGWVGFGSTGNDDLTIRNSYGGGHILVVPNGGNVGIGYTAPGQKLSVSGNLAVSGDATFGSINATKIGNITAADGTFTNVRINSATPDSYSVLTVKGHASQVAYLQEWQNSAGSTLSYVNSAGQGFFPALQGTGGVGTNTGGNGFYFNSSAFMVSPSAGIIKFSDNTDTSFNRLQFGGTTSSYPSIKRIGTGLFSRLADDSGMAPFSAGDSTFSSINSTKIGNTTPADATFTTIQSTDTLHVTGSTTFGASAGASNVGVEIHSGSRTGVLGSELNGGRFNGIVHGYSDLKLSAGNGSYSYSPILTLRGLNNSAAFVGAITAAGDATFGSINATKIGNITSADATFNVVSATNATLTRSGAVALNITNGSSNLTVTPFANLIRFTTYDLDFTGNSTTRFTSKVGINTAAGPTLTAPQGQIEVIADASTTKGAVIKGAASQSAHLTEWQNSSGTALASVGSGGDATFLQINSTKIGNTTAADGTFTAVRITSSGDSSFNSITLNRPGGTTSCLMIRDTDDAGWTEVTALNGVLTATTDADGVCDGA